MTPLDIDMNIIPAIVAMQETGIMINRDHFTRITKEFRDAADKVQAEIEAEYGQRINVRSGGEDGKLCKMLMDMDIYPKKLRTDAETLAKFRKHPIVQKVFEVKEYEHLISQFCNKLPKMADENDRVHTDILITRTATTRLASKNPNLQNISTRTENGRKIRQGFIAKPGCVFVSIDYSQIELRVAAHLSNDRRMLNAFRDGKDLHAITAAGMFGVPEIMVDSKRHRRPAKDVNFGVLYGITKHGLYDGFIKNRLVDGEGNPLFDEDDCERFISSWFHTWPECARYMQALQGHIRRNGIVKTMYGHQRTIPHVYSADKKLAEKGIREGGNTPIQGTAADIMKIAIKQAYDRSLEWKAEGLTCDVLMQIHDELLFEMDEDEWPVMAEDIRGVMENVVKLKVDTPCDIEQGINWGQMTEL
jgi:DNA polymerase-1